MCAGCISDSRHCQCIFRTAATQGTGATEGKDHNNASVPCAAVKKCSLNCTMVPTLNPAAAYGGQWPNHATSNNKHSECRTSTQTLSLERVGNHLEDFTDRHWTWTLQYWSGVRKLKLSGKTGTRHSRKLSSARKVSHPFTQAYGLQLAYQTCSLLTLKIRTQFSWKGFVTRQLKCQAKGKT